MIAKAVTTILWVCFGITVLFCASQCIAQQNTKPNSTSPPPTVTLPSPSDEVVIRKVENQSDAEQDVAPIAQLLRNGSTSEKQEALKTLQLIDNLYPRVAADALPQWMDPLLDFGQYDLVRDLAYAALKEKAFDPVVVAASQKALLSSYLREQNYQKALIEAKGYYNVVALKSTREAVQLYADCLARVRGADEAKRFLSQQVRRVATSAPSELLITQPPVPSILSDAGMLADVKLDASRYIKTIKEFEDKKSSLGEYSANNLIGRGNLLLLSDRPAEAQKCFESACKLVPSGNGKVMRHAVEGIALAVRAMSGNAHVADAYIRALRADPSQIASRLGLSSAQSVQTAAQQTALSDIQASILPPLEDERAQKELQNDRFIGDVNIMSDFPCATPLLATKISPTHFGITLANAVMHGNWFMFRVDGAAGQLIRIDLRRPGASFDNWITMNPVFSTGLTSIDELSSFEVGNDSADPGSLLTAWNGAKLPPVAAKHWKFIPDVWQPDDGTLSFVFRPESASSFVAMRVPYSPAYNEVYLDTLRSDPRVKLIEVGKSLEGRPLLLLEVNDGAHENSSDRPCVLVYAREHADEPDASWVIQGMIDYLLRDDSSINQLRYRLTFLFIPALDPDAAYHSNHTGIIERFHSGQETLETKAYMNWFQDWIKAGKRLDFVLNLHNVQSAESVQVACAFMEKEGARGLAAQAFGATIRQQVRDSGFSIAPAAWSSPSAPNRLGGWLKDSYGSMMLAYEFNSQDSERHLSITDLKLLGKVFTSSIDRFTRTAEADVFLANLADQQSPRLHQETGQTKTSAGQPGSH